MITPSYVRTMARYNSEMNRRVYAAAADLSDEQRKADRGLFWKSLHGTLNHLMWGDRQWMSRFDGWPANTVPNPGSPTLYADFGELRAERIKADTAIENLAGRVDEARKAGRRLEEEHPAVVVRGRGLVEVGPQLGDPRLEIVVAAGLRGRQPPRRRRCGKRCHRRLVVGV